MRIFKEFIQLIQQDFSFILYKHKCELPNLQFSIKAHSNILFISADILPSGRSKVKRIYKDEGVLTMYTAENGFDESSLFGVVGLQHTILCWIKTVCCVISVIQNCDHSRIVSSIALNQYGQHIHHSVESPKPTPFVLMIKPGKVVVTMVHQK